MKSKLMSFWAFLNSLKDGLKCSIKIVVVVGDNNNIR